MTHPHTTSAPSSPQLSDAAGPTPPALGGRELPRPAAPKLLTCSTSADFLAALPRLVGFTAPNSVFLVLFSGARAQCTVRVDLPPDERPATLKEYVDEFEHRLRGAQVAYGASAPAIVISSEQTFRDAQGMPWRRLAKLLDRRLARAGQRPRELCCQAPDAWASLYDPAQPRLGRPLAEIASSSVAGPPPPSLAELSAFRAPAPTELAEVARAAARLREAGATAEPAESRAACEAAVAALFAPNPWSPEGCASLLLALGSDLGWTMAFDELASIAALDGAAAEAGIAAAATQLSNIVPFAGPDAHGRIATLCALAWWVRGLESVAHAQLTEVLEREPELAVARLARRIVDTGAFVSAGQRAAGAGFAS